MPVECAEMREGGDAITNLKFYVRTTKVFNIIEIII